MTSPDELLGQLLVFGWSDDGSGKATGINDHARALIEEFRVGSVILFTRNVKDSSPQQIADLTGQFQEMARVAGLPPLLICADQEGGRVARFGPPHFDEYPTAWSIAESGDPSLAYSTAERIGREIKSVGLNWTLAPVLDVNNNPDNPVIGNRAFGAEPLLVARMGAAAVRGFQEGAGILACGKHFPGHGDTDIDSHKGLPRISHGRSRLDSVELVPFRAAIEAEVGSIMTTHILFDALDPELPSTLSPHVLTGLLRSELGYDGLIVTDDLEMKGVADDWGAPQAAVLAAIAGADVLMCCHKYDTQRAMIAALRRALADGVLSFERVEQSAERVALAKQQWISTS